MVYLLFKHNILKKRNIRTVSDKLPIKLIHIGREFVDQELGMLIFTLPKTGHPLGVLMNFAAHPLVRRILRKALFGRAFSPECPPDT